MKGTIRQNTNRQNLLQLLWLRIVAIIGQAMTILVVHYILKISLPLLSMFLVLLVLTIINCISFYRYKSQPDISDKSLFFELLFDVFALAAQLYFSGGISNPFISLFLLQVIIGAVLLEAVYAWLIAALTIICYVILSFDYQELHAFHHHEMGDNLFNLHLQGMLISYVFAAIILLIFITKIIKNLQDRDQKISLLKQQSLEKEQVVRMGLLATSAAHELGTPLSTILVIISDWEKMNIDKDLIADAKVIESQVNRCRKIISDILSSSGKSRLEAAKSLPVKNFFDTLIEEWKYLRDPQNLIYNFSGEKEKKIIADDLLSQAFFNILDNALDESPSFILVDVISENNQLIVTVKDKGKGFRKDVLEGIGQTNLSTKDSSGIGLFLAINILEMFGGKIEIANINGDGAKIIITIPLENL